MEQAFTHLRSLGHERIGMVLGPADHVPSARKLAAFEELVRRRPALVERCMFSMESGQAAGRRLLRKGATGIICASDVIALGVVRAARREGYEVPDDVSVIGFDDSALMSCTDPPLTTVRQPIEAMGRSAVATADQPDRGRAGLDRGAPVRARARRPRRRPGRPPRCTALRSASGQP